MWLVISKKTLLISQRIHLSAFYLVLRMTISRCRLTYFGSLRHNGILVQILTFACRHIHSGFFISLSVNSMSKSKLEFHCVSTIKKSCDDGNPNQNSCTRIYKLITQISEVTNWIFETSIFAMRIRARNPPSTSDWHWYATRIVVPKSTPRNTN